MAADRREGRGGAAAPQPDADVHALLVRATGCVVRRGARPSCDLIVGEEERRLAFASPADLAAFLREVRQAGIPIHRDGALPLALLAVAAAAVLAAALWLLHR